MSTTEKEHLLNVEKFTTWLRAHIDRCATFDKRTRPVVCGALADAIAMYNGPLIEPAIEAMLALPPTNLLRRYLSAAADVIAAARSGGVSLYGVSTILAREASQ